jgi:hypothetical protein
LAEAQTAPKKQSIVGKITGVDEDGKISVHVTNASPEKDMVIATTADTNTTLDDHRVKVSELKAGLYVHILVVGEQPASEVHAHTSAPKPKRKGDAPPTSGPASAPGK